MFRVIQIDPETLAIHLNAGAISAHTRNMDLFNFVDAVRVDGILSPLLAANKAADMCLLDFGTSYLHELRHFADLLLTPFGFYRINTAFEFFMNLPYLVLSSNEKIPIPLMSGMDPITRSAIGLGTGFEESLVYRLGLTSFSRVRIINAENQYDPANSSITFGGDRILEALAYITQFEFLFQKCDSLETRRHFSDFFDFFRGSEFDLAYRWFIPDCHKMHPGETMPNNTLMMAILFASLCGSVQPKVQPHSFLRSRKVQPRDVEEKLPSRRYYNLVGHFKENPRPSIEDASEAFELVNSACKNLFGCGIFEEIEEDLQRSENLVEDLGQREQNPSGFAAKLNSVPMLSELIKYRRLLFENLKRDPRFFCTSQGFYEKVAPNLQPSLIYYNSGGIPTGNASYSRLPGQCQWIGLFGRLLEPPDKSSVFPEPVPMAYAAWCPMQGDNGSEIEDDSNFIVESDQNNGLTVGYIDNTLLASRHGVYGLFAPMYHWILYGNKYLNITEAENYRLPGAFGVDDSKFVIDPFYEETEDISLPDVFLKFFDRTENYCDVCNAKVSKENSYLISARTMRQNHEVVKYYRALGADLEFKMLKLDWSDWLVCRSDVERFGFPIPRRTST